MKPAAGGMENPAAIIPDRCGAITIRTAERGGVRRLSTHGHDSHDVNFRHLDADSRYLAEAKDFMDPEIYEQLFVFSESAKTTAETIEGFAKYPQFRPAELSQFADSIRETRTRAAAYLTQIVLSEEKADVLRMMKHRELPPLVF